MGGGISQYDEQIQNVLKYYLINRDIAKNMLNE